MERERTAPAIVREDPAIAEALPAWGRLSAEARRTMLVGPPALTGFQGQPFRSFGEQMRAVHAHAVGNANDSRLVMAASGMSEGSPSDGGFMVQTDFSSELIRNMREFGEIANRVRRIPISAGANGLKLNAVNETSRATGSRWGGLRAYWAAEAGSLTASHPKLRQIELDLKKLTGLCYATDELLADASALEAS
jgi:HK97 family phage major capsid protein